MYDIANVCRNSAVCNVPVLVGTHDGKVLVNVYDWTEKLAKSFIRVPNIKSYQYFRMSAEEPGIVKCFTELTKPPVIVNIFRQGVTSSSNDLPEVIHPIGLSLQRQKYLYDEIREFCLAGTEDSVAPKPQAY